MALRSELHVLVVDDSSISREILRQMLDRFGVRRIDTTRNAEEAQEFLRSCCADLVICDLNMPGHDGAELLAMLRNCEKMRQAGFILTSGLDASPRIEAARKLGLDGLLVKPFQASDLLDALERVSGRL